jgi:2-keto-3-deoxy-L-rhamnonate aldolase RhmA
MNLPANRAPVGGELATHRIGGWLMIPDPIAVEAAGRAGFDWIGLDLQHGTWDLERAFRGIQLLDALRVPVFIRVSELELSLIPRVLDHGASGIVIAMATSPEMVAGAISMARYQPEGTRSYGGQRYGMRPEPADVSQVRPRIYPMIEDARGAAAVSDIARVPGVAGLHVGPVDLGLGMGLGMNRATPAFTDALRRIVEAAHGAGVPAIQHAVRGEQAQGWFEFGFDEVVITADIDQLRQSFAAHLAAARGESVAPPQATAYGRPVAGNDDGNSATHP